MRFASMPEAHQASLGAAARVAVRFAIDVPKWSNLEGSAKDTFKSETSWLLYQMT